MMIYGRPERRDGNSRQLAAPRLLPAACKTMRIAARSSGRGLAATRADTLHFKRFRPLVGLRRKVPAPFFSKSKLIARTEMRLPA